MIKHESDIVFIDKIRKFFQKARIVNKDDLGIYHYIWQCDTSNEESHGVKCDVFLKLKAIEIYDDLVEVEVMDIKINGSASQNISSLIESTLPKYVVPKLVQWIKVNI